MECLSILDVLKGKSYESDFLREIVRLENENKALKKENKAAWDQFNELSRHKHFGAWSSYPCIEDELEGEKIKYRSLECELHTAQYELKELQDETRKKDCEIERLKIQNKNLERK